MTQTIRIQNSKPSAATSLNLLSRYRRNVMQHSVWRIYPFLSLSQTLTGSSFLSLSEAVVSILVEEEEVRNFFVGSSSFFPDFRVLGLYDLRFTHHSGAHRSNLYRVIQAIQTLHPGVMRGHLSLRVVEEAKILSGCHWRRRGLAFDPLHSRWRCFMIIESRKCSSIHNVHLLSVLLSSTRAIVEFQSPFHQFATVATTHREGQQNPIEDSYEKEHAHKIFNIVSEVRFRKTDDNILDSLLNNQDCCAIQPSNSFVDNLLQRFNDDWKSALGLFRWASSRPGYRHSPEAYDKMVDILGKAKQIEKMWALVEEMRGGGIITRNTVAKIMRRLAGAGRLKDAVKVFDELLVMGVEKDVESMNLLLDTLCKEKRVELAREVFLELKAHITPNAHTFNIFIHGWCKVNRIDEAHWSIQEMKGYGVRPSVITYSTIIQAYCNQFNFRKVNELLDEMKIEGCSPNVVTYTTIMHSLAKSQETEEALQIFERMKADGCKPDTVFYNSLIYILGKAGQLSKAVHVFEVEMCKNGISPNVSTYNTMISVFCHHSKERNALNVLREMEESGLCQPDLLTYNPLLKQCFKTGKTDINLSKLLSDMVNKHHLSLDLGTYSLLVHGFCGAGKCESAYLLFEEMISQEITPRYRTCRVLLEELEQKNMNDHVERLKTYMKQMKGSSH